MAKELIIEHAANGSRFAEERKAVFLKGYYNLKEAELKVLEENKVSDLSNQTTKTK